MRRILSLAALAASLCGLVPLLAAAPAAAQRNYVYPYCLTFYEGPGRYSHQECTFVSIAQCRASASGRGGQCDVNPLWQQPVKKKR